MNIFTLSESKRTPEVLFNIEKAQLIFNGTSLPEDVNVFFSPLYNWMETNKSIIRDEMGSLSVTINLTYFNSASLKFLISLLRYLKNLKGSEFLSINWHYDSDDEDMAETAKDISSVLTLPISLIQRN